MEGSLALSVLRQLGQGAGEERLPAPMLLETRYLGHAVFYSRLLHLHTSLPSLASIRLPLAYTIPY